MDERGTKCLGLKEWYAPADREKIGADIVAVHGLGANPYWTWAAVPEAQKSSHWKWLRQLSGNSGSPNPVAIPEPASQTEVVWLEKFLPRVVPNARILAFGYQSNYWRYAPKRDIANIAQELLNALVEARRTNNERPRPIIFVGHSFGGIVVKEALIKSTLAAKRYGSIRTATRGLIFLGTPHHGASIASYGDMLVSIAKATGLGSNLQLVHSLREKSSELLKLASNFSDIYDDFDIFCFYELLPWKFGSVIVSQQSAVIEGRPSEGLSTDHSGLNKYDNEDDYCFRRVAREINRMVKSAIQPGSFNLKSEEARPGMFEKLKPWEISARLVTSIEEAFDEAMTSAQTDERLHALDIQRCRFRSWAYIIGLGEIHHLSQPLHPVLETKTAEIACDTLQCIWETISQVSGKTPQEDTPPTIQEQQAHFERLHILLNTLYSIFPENDKAASDQIFSATLLQPDNEGTLEIFESDSTLREFPDIGLVAAMKRVSLLRDHAEAVRPEHGKLSISMSDIVLDKVGDSSQQVLVEWKKYEGFWDTEIGNQLFNRTEMLTLFLRTASKSASLLDLRILNCLGYCHDEKHKRLGFVFSIPPSAGDGRSYVTLNSWIMQQMKKPAVLGDRFKLAQILCKARWFHKNFSSHNILFFPDTDPNDENEAAKSAPQPADFSLLVPYIVGFNNSRPDRPTEFSEPARLSLDMLRYRHPEYKSVAMQKYRREYDYYSLGIVLLELGLWFPLSATRHRHPDWLQLAAADFAAKVREVYTPQLGSFMGSVYRDVVVDLLDGIKLTPNKAQGELGSGGQEIEQMVEFQTRILTQLNLCYA